MTLSRFVAIAVWGVTFVNVVLAAGFIVVKQKLREFSQAAAIPSLSGIDVHSNEPWYSVESPCYVLRMTRDDCFACTMDELPYSTFLSSARKAACEIVEVSPTVGGISPNSRRNGVVQLKYVGVDLGPAVLPFATPYTAIINNERKVEWSRLGAFDRRALSEGIATLERIASGTR